MQKVKRSFLLPKKKKQMKVIFGSLLIHMMNLLIIILMFPYDWLHPIGLRRKVASSSNGVQITPETQKIEN